MDNQPTNDFLTRMDAANAPVQVEPEKKGPSKGLIIGIVVGVVAVIGIIVGILVAVNSGKKTTTSPVATYTDDPDLEIDEEMLERNEARKNDLVPLGEAVKKYQAEDAAGQLPGYENSSWDGIIAKFVPNGELRDGADGELYTMGKVCKFSEADCMDINSLSWEENKHQIYVMYNADCKGTTKENVIVSSTRSRHAAIFAIIEGDEFICATND